MLYSIKKYMKISKMNVFMNIKLICNNIVDFKLPTKIIGLNSTYFGKKIVYSF